MRPILILIARLRAPLCVPIRRAQVRDHDRDGLPRASAVSLPRGGDGTDVGELETFTTARAAPGGAAGPVEEALRPGGRVERGAAGGGLPGGHGGAGGAAAGAGLAVEVVLGDDVSVDLGSRSG